MGQNLKYPVGQVQTSKRAKPIQHLWAKPKPKNQEPKHINPSRPNR